MLRVTVRVVSRVMGQCARPTAWLPVGAQQNCPPWWWGWVSSRSAPCLRPVWLPRLLQPFTREVGTNSEYRQGCAEDSWVVTERVLIGLVWWLRRYSVCLHFGRPGFDPWVGKIPGEGNGNLLQYSCLGNPMDQRSLAGYSPWGHREATRLSHFTFHLFPFKKKCNRSIVALQCSVRFCCTV